MPISPTFVGGCFPISPIGRCYVPYQQSGGYKLTGISRDANNNRLGGCVVQAIDVATGTVLVSTTSDASGNFTLDVTGGRQFQLSAYLPGSPDVAGVTVNTLTGTYR